MKNRLATIIFEAAVATIAEVKDASLSLELAEALDKKINDFLETGAMEFGGKKITVDHPLFQESNESVARLAARQNGDNSNG